MTFISCPGNGLIPLHHLFLSVEKVYQLLHSGFVSFSVSCRSILSSQVFIVFYPCAEGIRTVFLKCHQRQVEAGFFSAIVDFLRIAGER